jgi:hypothetical protein
MAGELVVNLDANGNLRSMHAETSPDPNLSVVPQLRSAKATVIAVVAAARKTGVRAGDLSPSEPELQIFDPRLIDAPGPQRPSLVWRIEITSAARPDIRELVLVDAHLGAIAFQLDEIAQAKHRRVCDGKNIVNAGYPCKRPARSEGGPTSPVAEINAAYRNSGLTYDFYKQVLGRNSIDGKGMDLVSTIRFCVRGYPCPLPNASWTGTQTIYGSRYAYQLDVVAHEMTHGLTEFTSHLYYYAQSGAINESMSDVFGRFVELTAHPQHGPKRWRIADGLPDARDGIRDMRDPALFRQPDRMTSNFYTVGATDYLGVHTNSGVGNKAAYLITDGDTFNGQTVQGIGIRKAAKIYYEVQRNFLTSGSDYADLAVVLPEACRSLIGSANITLADCWQVDKAVAAVEMDGTPPRAAVVRAPVCPSGQVPINVFSENFENQAKTNDRWVRRSTGAGRWYYPPGPGGNPYRFDARYAKSGTRNLWGYGETGISDVKFVQKRSVAIPPNAYLRFDHAFDLDGTRTGAYDGGVVEYSSDGGSTWLDAGPLFTDGSGYNRTISGSRGNPLEGRQAFSFLSYGYMASRLDLSSLEGMDVRFRFRIGADRSRAWYGWFIDDVRIYTCASAPRASA